MNILSLSKIRFLKSSSNYLKKNTGGGVKALCTFFKQKKIFFGMASLSLAILPKKTSKALQKKTNWQPNIVFNFQKNHYVHFHFKLILTVLMGKNGDVTLL